MRLSIPSITSKFFLSHCLIIIVSCALNLQAQELNPFGNSYDFDYSATTTTVVLNKEGQGLFFWPPFNSEHLNYGVLLYAMILKYADKFEAHGSYGEADYHIIIAGPGQIRNYYLGLGWLEFEETVALLRDEDYDEMLYLIESRLENNEQAPKEATDNILTKRINYPFQSRLSTAESLKEAKRKIRPLFENNGDERWDNFSPKREVRENTESKQSKGELIRARETPDKSRESPNMQEELQARKENVESEASVGKGSNGDIERKVTLAEMSPENNSNAKLDKGFGAAQFAVSEPIPSGQPSTVRFRIWMIFPLGIIILLFIYLKTRN